MMDDLPKRHVRLGPGPEFDRIRRAIAGGRELPQAVRVGPGDDAAVLGDKPLGCRLCATFAPPHRRALW